MRDACDVVLEAPDFNLETEEVFLTCSRANAALNDRLKALNESKQLGCDGQLAREEGVLVERFFDAPRDTQPLLFDLLPGSLGPLCCQVSFRTELAGPREGLGQAYAPLLWSSPRLYLFDELPEGELRVGQRGGLLDPFSRCAPGLEGRT